MTARADSHAEVLAELGGQYLQRLGVSPQTPAPERTEGARRLARALVLLRQGAVRKGKELVQEHWDLALFDIVFGCVKAFGVYPALYFAGLTWTIPLMEYAPLNTQLWTAGYLFARRRILSELGRRRYGRSLIELDGYRDRTLGIDPPDVRSIHRFSREGVRFTLRVRKGRDWLRRLRRLPPQRNVLRQSELRQLVRDPELVFQANPLRSNVYLYEEVLLQAILASSARALALCARLTPETPLTGSASALRDVIGETPIPLFARVVEQGDALTASLRTQLGSGFSATSLALRWINWSHQRRIYGLAKQLAAHEYRLLASLLEGRRLAEAPALEDVRRSRSEIDLWIERASGFGERARALRSRPAAHALIDREIPRARAHGLSVRLARLARASSPAGLRHRRRPVPPGAGDPGSATSSERP